MKTRSANARAQVNTFLFSTEFHTHNLRLLIPIDDCTYYLLTTVFADGSKTKEKIKKRKLIPTSVMFMSHRDATRNKLHIKNFDPAVQQD